MNKHILYLKVLTLLSCVHLIGQTNVSNELKSNQTAFKKEGGIVQIKPMIFNSDAADVFPRFLEDGLVFSSNRGKKENPRSNFDLFVISDLSNPVLKKMKRKMSTRYNESSLYVTKNGKTVYFSRNKLEPNLAKRKTNEKVKLRSFSIEKNKNKYKKVIELPFNGSSYSVAHIVLNSSEDKLYFVSDMEGGYGGTDIYEVELYYDGTFGEPINLGSKVNTESNETSPFLIGDDLLYFASDNPKSWGGLDIFKVKLSDGEPLNLGTPINSEADDYGLIINKEYVFFASDRNETKGNDNIYSITPEELKVLEAQLQLSEIQSTISENINSTTSIVKNSEEENKKQKIEKKSNYRLDHDYKNLNRIVLFGFNRSELTLEYKGPLNDLAVFLKKHKEIHVILVGHTDQIGDSSYNLKLSQERSEQLKTYLVSNGVSKGRIIAIGKGEQEPVEKCTSCTKEQNRKNRRVEIELTGN